MEKTQTSTTTCTHFNPVFIGSGPAASTQFGSTTCYTISRRPDDVEEAAMISGFSYGDILIGFFLLVLVTGQFFGGILNRLIGVKIKP